MKRTELRETIFRLLFIEQFAEEQEVQDKVTLYLDEMRSGLMEVPYARYAAEEEARENAPAFAYAEDVRQEDEDYIRTKLGRVLAVLPDIDGILNAHAIGWKTSRMPRADLSALRLAVYEMLYDDDVPTGVAINEAVELAKNYGGAESASFVNGVLGKVAADLLPEEQKEAADSEAEAAK